MTGMFKFQLKRRALRLKDEIKFRGSEAIHTLNKAQKRKKGKRRLIVKSSVLGSNSLSRLLK